MTKEEALRQAEILQAYADGKPIQLKDKDSEPSDPWTDQLPGVDLIFDWFHYHYRIKPEPHTIPYTKETLLEALKHHTPFVYRSWSPYALHISAIGPKDLYLAEDDCKTYDLMLDDNYTWADTGEPFGQTLSE